MSIIPTQSSSFSSTQPKLTIFPSGENAGCGWYGCVTPALIRASSVDEDSFASISTTLHLPNLSCGISTPSVTPSSIVSAVTKRLSADG